MNTAQKKDNELTHNSADLFYLFTGGGSGGHVVTSLTVLEKMKQKKLIDFNNVLYIGGGVGSIEEKSVKKKQIPYKSIHSGKLKRSFFVNHAKEFFYFSIGFFQCFYFFLKNIHQKKIIFSSGGFISVPVVMGAYLSNKIKKNNIIFIHEQTSCVGLANKIASYFSDHIFLSFKHSFNFFPQQQKITLSGYPLRDTFYSSKPITHFNNINIKNIKKKIIYFTGGGNGSLLINKIVDMFKIQYKQDFFIFHQTGKKFIQIYESQNNDLYHAFDFHDDNDKLLKLADVIITRSGAGVCNEIIHLNKNAIFIPLKIAQKNEQYYNAKETIGTLKMGKIIEEDEVNKTDFYGLINEMISEHVVEKGEKKTKIPSDIIVNKIIELSL